MPARGVRRTGIVLALLYLGVLVATMRVGPPRVRPLYEGFTPPAPYRWVNPPKEFRAGNQKPAAVDTAIALGIEGSIPIGITSSDSQFILNLPTGAVPRHGADVRATARIEPLDPDKLGKFPIGLVPDGNAYRLRITYQPSRVEITHLAKPGNVFLTVPHATTTLLYSGDGRAWTTMVAHSAGGPGAVGAALTDTGWFAAAMAPGPETRGATPIGTIAVAAVTVLLALGLFFGPAALRRLGGGRAAASPARRPSGRRRQPAPRRRRGGRRPRRRGG